MNLRQMPTAYTSFSKRGARNLVRSVSPRSTPRLYYLTPLVSAKQRRWSSDRGSVHERYRYRQLKQARDIRILELKPARGFDDPLHLSLKQISLEDHDTHFEAVSYVWGVPRGNQEVFCDGEMILVTPNCESALRHLRLKTQSRNLWVDSLCINQLSTSDKNQQVPMMGDIFESAERVIIWLGPERSSVANFFRRVKLFNPFISPQLYVMRRFGPWAGHEFRRLNFISRIANWAWVHTVRSAEDSQILQEIAESSWFTRVWTLQEQLLSSKAVIVIGHHECPWEAFANIWAWNLNSIKSLGGNESPVTLRLLTWIAFQSTWLSRTKGGSRKMLEAQFDIYSGLLECARTHGASDPRDKVYAFLPLMQRIEPNKDPMPVRYDMSYPEVYEQFAKYSIRLSGTLRYLETLPPLRYESSLPSWVVDLQVPAKYPMRRWANSQLDARATGDSKVDLHLLSHSRRGELLLKGLPFSTIKRISAVAPLETQESADFAEDIATWFWNWRDTIREAVLKGELKCPYSSFMEGFHEFFDGVMRFNPYLGGCTLFITESGHLGVSQFSVEEGDEVVLLAGCALPTVLRASCSKQHCFFAVAYVAGISHGEAWNPRDSRSHEYLESFTLI
ncbi:hypothetical protein N8I77_008667 [Diaporthe amygdali]|uniref:Heterokaryon incompatibility domain-containing protein n=1 Tax=Phomopsis amygdali TaxID=1214568 RepID=A0AAD9W2F5_PHOAM|nr:hypothetical protein N8I77_008667 [Diaporthe amygdali]